MKIKWNRNHESSCGLFWCMKTNVCWRLYQKQSKQAKDSIYFTVGTLKECKEMANFLVSQNRA